MGVAIIKLGRSYNRPNFIMEIPIPGKTVFILVRAPVVKGFTLGPDRNCTLCWSNKLQRPCLFSGTCAMAVRVLYRHACEATVAHFPDYIYNLCDLIQWLMIIKVIILNLWFRGSSRDHRMLHLQTYCILTWRIPILIWCLSGTSCDYTEV